MTKENDFTLQELELIATQMPLISKNSDLMQKINAKIKNMTPRTIRIGEFDVPEPLREAPSDGTYLFVVDATTTSCAETWKWSSDGVDKMLLKRGLLHTTRDDATIHSKALISLTETK